MKWFKRTPESHEAKVMRIYTYDWDAKGVKYPWYPKIDRFVKREDGAVYDRSGRYHYSADLWERYMAEFRHPEKKHDFAWVSFADAPVDELGRAWPRQHALCRICGEKRVVSMFIDIEKVNGGWCK